MNGQKLKIAIIGTRGIPPFYGGFETFAEEISRLLVQSGYEVTVQCDKDSYKDETYNGVKLFYTKCTKSEAPLRYYSEGINWALKTSDVVIIAGTGGSIFYLRNLFRHKIIITNTDGIEYQRSKWSVFHRIYLFISEILAVYLSDYLVADSSEIKKYLVSRYPGIRKKIRVIEYGGWPNNKLDADILKQYNLEPGKYYLVVCRLEPENNVEMILDGYIESGSDLPLLVVGRLSDKSYVKMLLDMYRSDRIFFTDGIFSKDILGTLRKGCKAYLHGHSVGGTNPSLLEAMANGNVIICHDNRFNREVTGNSQLYFSNSAICSSCIREIEKMEESVYNSMAEFSASRIENYYNWENILAKYNSLLGSFDSF